MSIIMKGSDGNIVSVAMAINCKEFRAEEGEDGVIEKIECISRTVKPECKECSLINAVKSQRKGIDPKD